MTSKFLKEFEEMNKGECVAFVEWVGENHLHLYNVYGIGEHKTCHWVNEDKKVYTTEELYEKFINE